MIELVLLRDNIHGRRGWIGGLGYYPRSARFPSISSRRPVDRRRGLFLIFMASQRSSENVDLADQWMSFSLDTEGRGRPESTLAPPSLAATPQSTPPLSTRSSAIGPLPPFPLLAKPVAVSVVSRPTRGLRLHIPELGESDVIALRAEQVL
jgi:hypothetical protein